MIIDAHLHVDDVPGLGWKLEAAECVRRLDEAGRPGKVCDPRFHGEAVRRVAAALKSGLGSARPVTHVGTGRAKVERVASNRRILGPDGKVVGKHRKIWLTAERGFTEKGTAHEVFSVKGLKVGICT